MVDGARKHSLALVLLVAAAPGTSPAADNTFVYDNVGGWTIRTDADRSYNCFAEAEYAGGSIVRVSFDAPAGGLILGIGDVGWTSIEVGASYRVDLVFDDAPSWPLSATGFAFDTETRQPGLKFTFDAEMKRHFMGAFKNMTSLDVVYDSGAPLSLSLAGSHRAAIKLEECQTTMATQ